jgi:hypothetical protein
MLSASGDLRKVDVNYLVDMPFASKFSIEALSLQAGTREFNMTYYLGCFNVHPLPHCLYV